MAVDQRYAHPILAGSDEPVSKIIGHAVYEATYQEDSDPNVVRSLLDAWSWQLGAEEVKPLRTLSGEKAEERLQRVYMKRALKAFQIEGVGRDRETLLEIFEWPQGIPYDHPVPVRVLDDVAVRMADADAWTAKRLRDLATKGGCT